MLIGVISDTHDRLPAIDAGLECLLGANVRAIVHPGDIVAPFAARKFANLSVPFHVTYGNNDGERSGLKGVLPQIQDGPLWVEVDGKQVLVHHFIDWCRSEDIARADLVFTGHTHEVQHEMREGRLILNPGECCGWVTGRCTVAIVDTRDSSFEIRELSL